MKELHKDTATKFFADIRCGTDKSAECILVVNPSNPEQNGAMLEALVEAINTEFTDCRIFLTDTLESYFAGTTVVARKKGTQWIDAHRDILGSLADNIVRWDEIKKHASFTARRETVTDIYELDREGRKIIHMACARYVIQRIKDLKQRGRSYDERTLMRRMISYVQDEIAGLAVINEMNPSPEIYREERYGDQHVFGRLNQLGSIDKDITIPNVYSIKFMLKDNVDSKAEAA